MSKCVDAKRIKIGLMGLDFVSANLGCQALSFGFLKIICQALNEMGIEAEITSFSKVNKDTRIIIDGIDLKEINECILTGNRTREQRHNQVNIFRNFDFIFDFTAGDSFSDIYGLKRFISCSLEKENVIKSKTPLILGNQTYGPFKTLVAKVWAKHIVRCSKQVFTRDHISARYLMNNFKVSPFESIDVAFALPYYECELPQKDKIRVGFNASGLLWNGGYTGNNQFGLSVDYKKYCLDVLSVLTESEIYEVHLIGHVISDNLKSNDNDLHAIMELKKKYPMVIVAPSFTNPISAKSYISKMDIFIGARMHATIGAFSSGVPTIPVAYSRKFEGVFSDLQYGYIIDCCTQSTEEAISKTIQYINDRNILKEKMTYGSHYIEDKLKQYKLELKRLLLNQ